MNEMQAFLELDNNELCELNGGGVWAVVAAAAVATWATVSAIDEVYGAAKDFVAGFKEGYNSY